MDYLLRCKKIIGEIDPFYWVIAVLLTLLLFWFGLIEKRRDLLTVQPTVESEQSKTSTGTIRLAVVIDDVGYDIGKARRFFKIHPALTFAVIPSSPHAVNLAREAHHHGHQVIIHMPMQAEDFPADEAKLLTIDMQPELMRAHLQDAYTQLPFAVGLNNHMGSKFTASPTAVDRFLSVVRDFPLFVLDSRTASRSLFASKARQAAIPTLERDVFLDNVQKVEAIEKQLEALIKVARQQGEAIGIGHPYRQTASALRNFLPRLRPNEQLVPLSQLLLNER